MTLFVRFQEGLNTRGSIIPLEDFNNPTKLSEMLSVGPNSDWYSSLFSYPEDMKQHFSSNNSVAGYKGPAVSTSLVWDFDSKSLEEAKNDVRELLNRLAKQSGKGRALKQFITIYFSGNKGFHVELRTGREFSPKEMKIACSKIAEGLPSFDTVIYNSTRAFRIPNTKHGKSGLFKIEVDPGLLSDPEAIDKIKQLAINPVSSSTAKAILDDWKFIDTILEENNYKDSVVVLEDVQEVDGIRGVNLVDYRKAKNIPKCIYALSQGVMKPGEGHRHHIFLHLGNFYRNQGHNREVVHGTLKSIARLNKQLYPEHEEFTKEEIWNNVIKMVFSDENTINPGGWGVTKDDPIFASYCKSLPGDCKCPIHDKTITQPTVSIDDIAKDFDFFATNFQDNVITTGIKFLDDKVKICTGTTTSLIGSAGVGKTSAVLHILEHTNKEDYASMFFSLDMGKNLLYLKLAQRLTGWDQNKIFNAFKQDDRKLIFYIKDKIKEYYGNTFFDFSGMLTLEDMTQRIEQIEDKYSKKIKLVVVDYASRIKGPYSDSNANEAYNALASKDAADKTQSAWLILNQISRASGDGATPLRTKRVAKGSSAWEESVSTMITMWRSFMGLDGVTNDDGVTFHDKYMNIAVVKNRLGAECEDVLLWQGDRGMLHDMDDVQREQYETEEKKKIKLAAQYRYANRAG